MAVLEPSSDAFRNLAERIATDEDEQVITDLEEVDATEPVRYVEHPSEIDEEVLLDLQDRSLREGPEDGAFCVVTGYDADRGEQLYYRDDEESGKHGVVIRQGPDGLKADDDAVVHTGDELTTANLRRLNDDGLRSLALQAGGWSFHFHLDDGFLCGVPELESFDGYDGPQPYCVQDGEKRCPHDGNLIAADTIEASHLFVAGCGSMIDNVGTGLPVHIGMGLLRGATSVIGRYRSGPTRAHVPILHYSLLRAGYTASERCYVLNQNAHANDVMSYPYIPFGRPDAGLAGPKPESPAVTVDDSHEDGTAVVLHGVEGYVADVTIPGEACPPSDDGFYVRAVDDVESGLYYTAFEEQGDLRVIVYAGRPLSIERLELLVSDESAHGWKLDVAYDALQNADVESVLGILPDEAENIKSGLRSQFHSVQEPAASEQWRLTAHADAKDQVKSLFGEMTAIRDRLLTDLTSGDPLRYRYGRRVVDGDVYPTNRDCHNCGRRLFLQELASSSTDARRGIGICPHCHYVFDVPVEPGDREPTYPLVTGDLHETGETERQIRIEFENPTDEPMHATIAPQLYRIGNTFDDRAIFDPVFREAELAPGERTVAEFEFDTRVVYENEHYVDGIVIGNLMPYVGTSPLMVGEKTGYLPPGDR